MTEAPVNRIIPISTVDGSGARTAIFLQGCNIACAYCHNPETQRLCTACGACVPLCPVRALQTSESGVEWDPLICTGCDTCIQVCPHRSSPKVRLMSAAQVMEQVEKNMPFVRGITVSGGECTLYPDFLTELFRLAKRAGLHCLLDSNGTVDFAALPCLMEHCDGVMLDVKAWDAIVYRSLTGEPDNAAVKGNLRYLAAQGKLEELRIVCLCGEVDAPAVIRGCAGLLGEATAHVPLKLITFRPNGVRGRLSAAPPPPREEMTRLAEQARNAGFRRIIIL